MNLTVFNVETAPRTNVGRNGGALPRITFARTGIISLNSKATELLNVSPGDKISIAQDSDTPEIWYVYKDEKNGFEVRIKNKDKSLSACFNHVALKNLFLESLGYSKNETASFLIGGDPTFSNGIDYYGILIQ